MIGKRSYWFVFLVIIAAYIAVTMGAPDPETVQKYHLTTASLRLLYLTIIVPITAIWIVAFYGALKMKEYAAAVRGGKEGIPFDLLATGLIVSVAGFPLTSAVSAALKNIALHHPQMATMTTVVQNYTTLLASIIAFYFIGRGAGRLALLVKKPAAAFDNSRWTMAFIAVSCIFSWLIISHYGGNTENLYHMPDWLVISTLGIPYVWVWYQGAMAAYCIYYYQKKVKGTIYRQALKYCSIGIGGVIATSVFIQVILVFSERLNRLHLTPVLLIIYFLVFLYAVGYGFIAKGAKKLKTLEDI